MVCDWEGKMEFQDFAIWEEEEEAPYIENCWLNIFQHYQHELYNSERKFDIGRASIFMTLMLRNLQPVRYKSKPVKVGTRLSHLL